MSATATPTLLLAVPARSDSIAIVRQAVAGVCEGMGASAETIGDVRLAVSEACTNAVVHAYAGVEPGPVEIEADTRGGVLEIAIRDRGAGVRPAASEERLGLGLPLIASLSRSMTITEREGGGTSVVMTFDVRSAA